MPKNCPLGKKDSHACWWCGFKAGDDCLAPALLKTFENVSENYEKVRLQAANCECLDCFHFKVCSRFTGGMDLIKCEDYVSRSTIILGQKCITKEMASNGHAYLTTANECDN